MLELTRTEILKECNSQFLIYIQCIKVNIIFHILKIKKVQVKLFKVKFMKLMKKLDLFEDVPDLYSCGKIEVEFEIQK